MSSRRGGGTKQKRSSSQYSRHDQQRSGKASPKACAPGRGGGDRDCGEPRGNYGNHPLAQIPLATPTHFIFSALYMYLYDPAALPTWTITPYVGFEATSGYIQVPIAAASAFGFDVRAPRETDPVVIGNYVANPAVLPFVNVLPAAVTASLYSVRYVPTPANPFYVLKPFNSLSSCNGWEAQDMIFVKYGPFFGGRSILQIGSPTAILQAFFGPRQVTSLARIENFMISPPGKACAPQGLKPEFGAYGCDDGDSSSSCSSSSSSSYCSSDSSSTECESSSTVSCSSSSSISSLSLCSSSSSSRRGSGKRCPPRRPQPGSPPVCPPKSTYAPVRVFEGCSDDSGSSSSSSSKPRRRRSGRR